MGLGEALDRAVRIYDREHLRPLPVDKIAQHLGYKSANNGAALQALASMRYFGLLERPEEGMMAVTADVAAFRSATAELENIQLLRKWLKAPPIFAELVEKYGLGPLRDEEIRQDLIRWGFKSSTAESVLRVFERSVEYVNMFGSAVDNVKEIRRSANPVSRGSEPKESISSGDIAGASSAGEIACAVTTSNDRIPVRLSGGRRAWIEIPADFYEADKIRLKNQIDLLFTEDGASA